LYFEYKVAVAAGMMKEGEKMMEIDTTVL